MIWGLAFWFAAVWSGWSVFRHHSALISVLPAGAMLAGSLNYAAVNPRYLIPLVGATLILIAVTNYGQQEQYWVNHNIDYAENIRPDLSFVFIILTLGFMVTSALAPSISIQQIISASQKITQRYQTRFDSIAKSLGLSSQSQETNHFSSIRNPDLPRSHLLGSGPELSKEVVMVVQTSDYPPAPSIEDFTSEPPHYYWRSTTYDIYTGHGWATSAIEVTKFSSNQAAIEGFMPITGTSRVVRQSIQLTQDVGNLIFSAGQLISVDKGYQVAWRLSPAGSDGIGEEQIVDEFAATYEGNTYTVKSFINTLSLGRLRISSGNIPTWINHRYLMLPENLPDRVVQLAISLTEDKPTEYDRAAAIESYLRTITYTLDLPSPPSDQDIVDYFLFDLKRGYCDYYASAMVIMARAIGLPAKFVTGYATGVYDPINARYIVTEANAHSWVEVYLAGIGWVEFEPTGGISAIQRSSTQIDKVEIPQIRRVEHFNLLTWFWSINWNWLVFLGASFGTLALGILLWVSSDRWRLYHLSPSMTIVQLYQRLYRHGHPLAEQFQTGDTPYEYASHVKQGINMLRSFLHWNFYFDHAIEEVTQLTNLYALVVYSPHSPRLEDQNKAINIWSHLRIRLWLAVKLRNLTRISFKTRMEH
jgi:transglutaminase-like putative cysteine protease